MNEVTPGSAILFPAGRPAGWIFQLIRLSPVTGKVIDYFLKRLHDQGKGVPCSR